MGARIVEATGAASIARLEDAVMAMRANFYTGTGETRTNLENKIGDVATIGDEDGALAGASNGDIKKAAFLGVRIGVWRGEHGGGQGIVWASGRHAEVTII